MTTLAARLIVRCPRLPCAEARNWLGSRTNPRAAWRTCPRGEWSLWLAQQVGVRPTREWIAQNIVAVAFDHAADELDCAGVEHDLRQHAQACREATAGTVLGVLRAARRAAARAAFRASTRAMQLVYPVGVAGADTQVVRTSATRAAARAAAAWAAEAADTAGGAADAAAAVVAAAAASGDAQGAAAEHARCAAAVRTLWPEPPAEVLAMLGLT